MTTNAIASFLHRLAGRRFNHVELARHEETWMEPAKLGSVFPKYHPTYPDAGFLNDHHAWYSTCPAVDDVLIDIGIPGWLRRDDALKIYELAYHSAGDILEIGTYQGLSTSIISTAINDSGKAKQVVTVDMGPEWSAKARGHLTTRGLADNVDFRVNEGAEACRELIARRRKFGFIFVDHSHEYEPVAAVCRLLGKLTLPRALVLFHDFNDPRNNDPSNKDYGVSGAVIDGLPSKDFEFHGIFGCAALYRARR
jgi:hypothetical protein